MVKKRIAGSFDRSIDATAITGNHCAVSYAKSSIEAKIESNGVTIRIQLNRVQQLQDRSTDHISKKTLSLRAFFRSVFFRNAIESRKKEE